MKKLLTIAAFVVLLTTPAQAAWYHDAINTVNPMMYMSPKPEQCGNNSACGMINDKCVDARCKDASGKAIAGCMKTDQMIMCSAK